MWSRCRCPSCWRFTGSCDLLFAGKLHMETHSRVKSRPIFVRRIWKTTATDYRWTHPHSDIPGGHRNWHPSVRGPLVELNAMMESICVVSSLKDPDGDIPAAALPHSKRMTTGWLSKPLSGICLIWSFCLHLPSAPRLKATALPLFASLLGSEENDNNEAWRLSTASHTNIHTYNTRNTDDTANADPHNLTLCYSRHTYIHTYALMQCEMNAGSHKHLLVPHQVCKYTYLQFTAKSSFNIVLYASVLYFIIILSCWLKRYSILQNVRLCFVCSSLIRLHKESRWVAVYVYTQYLTDTQMYWI